MNNSQFLQEVSEVLSQSGNRLFQIIYEENLNPRQISKDEFIKITKLDQKNADEYIDKVFSFLTKIYHDRFESTYGSFKLKVIEFFLYPEKSVFITVGLVSKHFFVDYYLTTNAAYKISTNEIIPSNYYILYSMKNGETEEIEEGTTQERYTKTDKYGFLLNVVAKKNKLNILKMNRKSSIYKRKF